MDLINEANITDKIINPALDRILKELVPELDSILKNRSDALVLTVSTEINQFIDFLSQQSLRLQSSINEFKTQVEMLNDFIKTIKVSIKIGENVL